MSRYNRTCILCGKEYKFCSNCKEESHQPAWKNIYCSENCRSIFNTAVAYADKSIDIKEAKKRIDHCDLSEIENFKEDIKKLVFEIIAVELPQEQVETDNHEIENKIVADVNPDNITKKSEEQPKKQEFIAKRSMKKSNK